MPQVIEAYVRYVEAFNRRFGRMVMWLIFVMMGVLLYSAFTKAFFIPPLWAIEMAQFVMVAYYMLGGAYSIQLGDHVRMDLLYGRWSERGKARADVFTSVFLIVYLIVLLFGAVSSTHYALEYGERSYSAWRPYMAPIKSIMCVGIILVLLQAVATLFTDIAKLRGTPIR